MEKTSFEQLKPKTLERTFKVNGESITLKGEQMGYYDKILASEILRIPVDEPTKDALKLKDDKQDLSKDQEDLIEKYNEAQNRAYSKYTSHILESFSNVERDQIQFLFTNIGVTNAMNFALDIIKLGSLEDAEKKQ